MVNPFIRYTVLSIFVTPYNFAIRIFWGTLASNKHMMKVFLTGGTGFIGSYVAMELLKHDHQVTVLARDKDKVPVLNKLDGIEVVEGDLGDFNLIEQLLAGKEACIHVALKYTKQTGSEVLLDDTLPTIKMSDMAVAAGIKHFIYTSSTAAHDALYSGGRDQDIAPDNKISIASKQYPATFYGATKTASENYLMAQSFQSSMRVNIIRPGYTFGNPVITGSSMQSDSRIYDIVNAAKQNKDISVIKYDGTQFIWAADLAKLYLKVLHSECNRRTYFGLSREFTSWHRIAEEAVKLTASNSRIHVEDKGWEEDGLHWDVSDMKKDFDLDFESWSALCNHLKYLINKN